MISLSHSQGATLVQNEILYSCFATSMLKKYQNHNTVETPQFSREHVNVTAGEGKFIRIGEYAKSNRK